MRILLSELRQLARIILESYEADKEDLISLYPENEGDISRLNPKWIRWLSTRFGSNPSEKEIHPFGDSLTTVLSFSKKDSAISQKYKDSEQWRNAVDEEFPNRRWKNPADATTMSVDDMEKLIAMSQRKKQNVQTRNIDVSGDLLTKIGPWNIWFPSTRENSCVIAGTDPLTGKGPTTWCTARTAGSNLFYNYAANDVVLFYLIKDDPSSPNDRISLGFKNKKLQYSKEDGGITVNAENSAISKKQIQNILGIHFEPIIAFVTDKMNSVKVSPARAKIDSAAQSASELEKMLVGLSVDEKNDLKRSVAGSKLISDEVSLVLSKDPNEEIRRILAMNRNISKEIFLILTKDPSSHVITFLLGNLKEISSDMAQNILNRHSESRHVTDIIAAKAKFSDMFFYENMNNEKFQLGFAMNKNTSSEILNTFAKNDELKFYVAGNPAAPQETLRYLAKDKEKRIRRQVSSNENCPPDVLALLAKEEDQTIHYHIASNKNTPIDVLRDLIKNPSVSELTAKEASNAIKRKLKSSKVYENVFQFLKVRT